MNWQTVFEGKIWRIQQGQHQSGKTFEKAVRSPGSRLIVTKDGCVLLSREKRHELGGRTDYRLPGGKVFDTNEAYVAFLGTGQDVVEASRKSIVKEALEETGLVIAPDSIRHLGIDVLGATCEWDLFYWTATDVTESSDGAQHHETEADEIEGYVWVPFAEARVLALDPEQFSESRSARMLLRHIGV